MRINELYRYKVISESYVIITSYLGEEEKISIPETIEQWPVLRIGNRAFYKRSSLQFVSLPEKVDSIGYQAFYGCKNLKTVTIPNNSVRIGEKAFAGCPELSLYSTDNSNVKEFALANGLNFEEIDLSNNSDFPRHGSNKHGSHDGSRSSLADIDSEFDVMMRIVNKNKVGIHPRNLDSSEIIQTESLRSNNSDSINDKSTHYIYYGDFLIIDQKKVRYIGNEETVFWPVDIPITGRRIFTGCSSIRKIIIPEGVTVIPEGAFWNCRTVSEIIIPDSVIEIEDYAFSRCNSLKKITLPEKLEIIGDCAFANSGLEMLEIPDSVTHNGKGAFHNCNSLTRVKIPKTITAIGICSFFQGNDHR